MTPALAEAANDEGKMLPPNTILKDNMFGEIWIVISQEIRDDDCLFYRIRNEHGQELLLAEWAVPFFRSDHAAA